MKPFQCCESSFRMPEYRAFMAILGMKSDIVIWNGQAGENQGKSVQNIYRTVAKIVKTRILIPIPKLSPDIKTTRPTANRKRAI